MALKVALYGAAGKMGTRISDKLRDDPELEMLYVEADPPGEDRLRARGLSPTSQERAAREADILILAIPDIFIGSAAAQIVPAIKSGAMLVCLDPAAPHAGVLPERDDISYFVAHPCHPPIVSEEPAAADTPHDFFGGVAGQHMVCSLMQGPESDYVRGEMICRKMFAPVMRAHRVTVEQMAILEPAMAETVVLTCMTVMHEAMQEAIARGVPSEAALDFMLGHMNANLGILFGFIDAQVSDGAKLTLDRARKMLLKPDWRRVFEPSSVREQVEAIVEGSSRPGQ